jgi:tellurite methyltransferase
MTAPEGSSAVTGGPGYQGRFDAAGWDLIRSVLRVKRTLPHHPPSLIDLGMGRGRDILYLARKGFRVTGIDLSPIGVEKAKRRATRLRVPIRAAIADLRTYRITLPVDVVFSSGSLNHLSASIRARRFDHFKRSTHPGGIHAVNAFLLPPGVPTLPDMEPGAAPFRPGELRGYYDDWDILEGREFAWECAFGGAPHRHLLDAIVARKPG